MSALVRPPLMLRVYEAAPGRWAARGELHTSMGPVVFTVEAPAEMVRQYVQASFGAEPYYKLAGAEFGADEIGFWNTIKKGISKAQKWAAKQVVQQSIGLVKAALPKQAQTIIAAVAKKTGLAPAFKHVEKAFELGARALTGDIRAKAIIKELRAAVNSSPTARALYTTVMTTAKMLPAVRNVVTAAEAGVALAEGKPGAALAAAASGALPFAPPPGVMQALRGTPLGAITRYVPGG